MDQNVLDDKTKALLKLVSALTLRNESLVMDYLDDCSKIGISDKELIETLAITQLVRGNILEPLIRRIWEKWESTTTSKTDE